MTEHNGATSSIDTESGNTPPRQLSGTRSRNAFAVAGALGLVAAGFVGGAVAWSATRPHDVSFDNALTSTAIAQLADASSVSVDGQVAEIYGNKFVITNGKARALVETGRAGEGGQLIEVGEKVTIQGRFDDGFLHAAAIRHADQRIDELDPPPPPPHGHGPRHGEVK